jgi:hypothetical protein
MAEDNMILAETMAAGCRRTIGRRERMMPDVAAPLGAAPPQNPADAVATLFFAALGEGCIR